MHMCVCICVLVCMYSTCQDIRIERLYGTTVWLSIITIYSGKKMEDRHRIVQEGFIKKQSSKNTWNKGKL